MAPQVKASYAKSAAWLAAREEAWEGSLAGETEAMRRKIRTLKMATMDRKMAPMFDTELDRETHSMPVHIRTGLVNVAVQFPAGGPDAAGQAGSADAAAVDTSRLAAANAAAARAGGGPRNLSPAHPCTSV